MRLTHFSLLLSIYVIISSECPSVAEENRKESLVDIQFDKLGNFGISLTEKALKQLNLQGFQDTKGLKNPTVKLTFSETGSTNNLMAMINQVPVKVHFGNGSFKVTPSSEGGEKSYEWVVINSNPNLEFVQTLKIVEGDQSGELDTVVCVFSLKNNSQRSHSVAFRFLLDSFIGSNDGVPFTIPSYNGLCSTFANFNSPRFLPEYVEALEFPNLANPGVVAKLSTVVSARYGNFSPVNQLILTAWDSNPGWNLRISPFLRDSAIGLYWKPSIIKPGEVYECAFTYGLQALTKSNVNNGMAISTGGIFEKGKNAIVVVYIDKPTVTDSVSLEVDQGIQLDHKTPQKQKVIYLPGQPYGQVTWKMKLNEQGTKKIIATRSSGVKISKEIVIR